MHEDTRLESDLIKSLDKLDSILQKSQIQHGKGNEPAEWAGTKVEKLGDMTDDDEITTEKNGTDGKVSKSASDDVKYGVEVSQFISELTKAVAIHSADLHDFVVKSITDLHAENGCRAGSKEHH